MPPTQNVQVRVIHRRASVIPRIYDYAVSLVQRVSASDPGCRSHEVSEQRSMLRKSFRLRGDVLLRNDEKMSGRLRVDIRKAYTELILIDPIGRDGTGNDFAKQTVIRHRRIRLFSH